MLTLRTFTDNPALHLTVLVPGPPGALDRPVTWVHNTELPDPSPYVRENELVLTNGLWNEDGCPPGEFVAAVRRARAAGIVFGLRESVTTTPPSLIDACRRAHLPLLELVIAIPFTALSQAAAACLQDETKSRLEASVRRGNALAAAISGDTGVSGALTVLHQEFGLPLAVVDRLGRPLALAAAHLSEEDLHLLGDTLTRRPPPLEVAVGPAGTATVIPVGVPGDITTALVCLRPAATLQEPELAALQQAAHYLTLDITRRRAVDAIEQRFAGELIDMITSGADREADLARRLTALGIDPAAPLAVTATAHAAGPDPVTTTLVTTARQIHLSDGIPAVLIPGSRDLIAVIAWQRPVQDLRPWLDRLATRLDERCPGLHTVIGYSAPADGHARLRTPLRQARQACHTLTLSTTGPSTATLAELPSHITLLGNLDAGELQRFADTLLGPLRTHDTTRTTHLEATLRAFLDRGGHAKATADALYIHVNTLRKRLARIADLTGRDPQTFHGQIDLYLALRADALITP
ncbi:PucR family transcriptional regulator [Streptomyces lushanensis]|uniref:PucR family transcriptional regulator n=1 Tax=Streptomyces lushanensis TaxID=1434255 RepID=UPI0008337083|nr:PucR family transcriptional regulator [Streptomyces lushanensis]